MVPGEETSEKSESLMVPTGKQNYICILMYQGDNENCLKSFLII